MDQKMFCYQCEQTAHCSGCTGASGVCGKSAEVAQLQDELTGALIGLARATDGDTHPDANTWRLIVDGLFTTVTNVHDPRSYRPCPHRARPPCPRLLRLRQSLRTQCRL